LAKDYYNDAYEAINMTVAYEGDGALIRNGAGDSLGVLQVTRTWADESE
jgi:hypothetical protein